MGLKKHKLTEEGKAAADKGINILTKHQGTDHRIVIASITDAQAKILLDKGHPFIEAIKSTKEE